MLAVNSYYETVMTIAIFNRLLDLFKTASGVSVRQMPADKGRSAGIDQFRFFAFMGVFFIHFVGIWNENHSANISYAFQALSFFGRFAVPFFFIASGFFLKFGEPSGKLVGRYASRLLLPFVVWGAVYWVEDVFLRAPYDFGQMAQAAFYEKILQTGGAGYHLWYLTSLFVAVAILVFARRLLSLKQIACVAAGLFVVGLAFRSYAPVVWGAHPPLTFDTRNGVFFGLLFVTLGAILKDVIQRVSFKAGVVLLAVGCGMLCVEAAFLRVHSGSWILGHDFLFGTVPVGIGAFITAARWPFKGDWFASLGRVSLGLYAAHLFFLKLYVGFFPANGLAGALAYLLLSFVSSVAVVVLIGQWRRTRFLVA